MREDDSVLRIAGGDRPLRILDLACGTGLHAVHWAKQGHAVTGVDLSETFIAQARERMSREGVSVRFVVLDIRNLAIEETYDLAAWIEASFLDEDVIARVRRSLAKDGCFILDVRNPENPKAKSRQGNWRTWREENGVFYLERHETDDQTGAHEDTWITIDPHRDVIEERTNIAQGSKNLDQATQVLAKAGFNRIELYTMDGQVFPGGPEPYWLWLVGRT